MTNAHLSQREVRGDWLNSAALEIVESAVEDLTQLGDLVQIAARHPKPLDDIDDILQYIASDSVDGPERAMEAISRTSGCPLHHLGKDIPGQDLKHLGVDPRRSETQS